ncbi:MAG: GNAT family N-acetyltransferase [bacterium]
MPMTKIKLKPITEHQFETYSELFIEDYAQDLHHNYDYCLTTARKLAKTDLLESFPDGALTKDQSLMSIQFTQNTTEQTVGYLWYGLQQTFKSAFIYDFIILDHLRNKGYGQAALKELSRILNQQGISRIKLRVAHNNPRAQAFYSRLGFKITGTNMLLKEALVNLSTL